MFNKILETIWDNPISKKYSMQLLTWVGAVVLLKIGFDKETIQWLIGSSGIYTVIQGMVDYKKAGLPEPIKNV